MKKKSTGKIIFWLFILAIVGLIMFFSIRSCVTDDTPRHVCEHDKVWYVEGDTHYLKCKDPGCTADNGKPTKFAEGKHVDANNDGLCDMCARVPQAPEQTPEEEVGGPTVAEKLREFTAAINSKNTPLAIAGVIDMNNGFLTGAYTVIKGEGDTFVVDYAYQMLNGIEEGGADEVYKTIAGSVSYENGKYISGDNVTDNIAKLQAAVINLDQSKLQNLIVDSGSLVATVKAANTKAVLGVEYDTDVTFQLTIGNGNVSSFSVSTDTFEIFCEYVY